MHRLRPPCWPEGQACPHPCAAAHYDRVIHNRTSLHGPWSGWRMAGHHIINPHGERLPPHVLDRMMWRHVQAYGDLGPARSQKRSS
ncbi:hypothetical protein EBB59_01385 [Lysobacter pythonis]|uniref:Uncharacterized protein n=1 Tax=Solilutibacter pythonis TaxID=2483112 RepID=A0A3M2I3U2_9GAMM|nr:hypothetical protein EBB59_01385 [Lysobacter pythonis]